jgi:hypothetical protein
MSKIPMTKPIRHSSFVILSSLGFRHSSFSTHHSQLLSQIRSVRGIIGGMKTFNAVKKKGGAL